SGGRTLPAPPREAARECRRRAKWVEGSGLASAEHQGAQRGRRSRARGAPRTPLSRRPLIGDVSKPPCTTHSGVSARLDLKRSAARQLRIVGRGDAWVLQHANPRRSYLDLYTLEAAQKGNEGFGVVGGEDPADFEIPQRGRGDVERFRGVAIEFGRNTLQRFLVKHNLSMQPSRGALRVHGCGRGRPFPLGHPYLLVGTHPRSEEHTSELQS